MSAYQKLCAEFYDLSKPQAPATEIAFYTQELSLCKGPVLEAMCGTGRLLVPLLKRGVAVSGVDNSVAMLARCARRVKESGLFAKLYNQNIEQLCLPSRYEAIIVAVGSLQLITNRHNLITALGKFRQHLLPGGIVLIDTFFPEKPENVQARTHAVPCPDGATIELHSKLTVDLEQRQYNAFNRYIKKKNGSVVQEENEHLSIRWYHKTEMVTLLEKAGFEAVSFYKTSFEPNSTVEIYRAVAGR